MTEARDRDDGSLTGVDATMVREHVTRVLESPPFARAPRMQRLLSFLVEESLAGRAAQLKEYTIATSVFGRPDDFDPGTSAVVRVEAGRLRRLLAQYQSEHGRGDCLWIQVPKGSYVPVIDRTAATAPAEPSPSITVDQPSRDRASVIPPWLSEERRMVTALSCAVTDQAAEYAATGELLTLLDSLHERCAQIALSHGGQIDSSAGDRLMVYFGWPSALEDSAGRALTAALEMMAATEAAAIDQSLTLRIGIATSEAITRGPAPTGLSLRPAVIGEAPALATRMQLRVPPGCILVAESTRRMAGAAFHFLPAGELDPGEGGGLVWRLLGARSATTRFRARDGGARGPIIGRCEEAALLMSRWRLSLDGEGQAVMLLGEAGIGKSRLAEAALEGIRRAGIRLRVQCSAHHSTSALFPVVEQLKARLGLAQGRDPDPVVARVLGRLGMDDDVDRALLTELISVEGAQDALDLSASQRKRLTLSLLTRLVIRLANVRPTVLLVEDVHWADPTTLELLHELVEAAAHTRLFVLVTSRPEGAPKFSQQTNVTAVRLARLPREDCSALIDGMVRVNRLSSASRALILERAEGIPLFLEELTKLLLAVQPLDPNRPAVPESLSDLLAAQLDRLGPMRPVAQVAAAIGRAFPREMLALAWGHSDAEVESALDQLLAAGILVRDRSDAAQTYAFRHALLRDAAYRSLLEPARRRLHLQVGNMLIESFPELAAEQPEVVAHHLFEGGRADESIPFWIDAGRMSASRYALDEAIAHFRMALTALESRPDCEHRERELALLLELGLVIRSARGYGEEELRVIYERAQTLAEDVGRPSQQLEVVYALWTHAAGRGQWRWALELATEFERRAATLDIDDQLEVEGLRLLGACDAFMGNFLSARERHERAIGLYDPATHGPRFGFDPGAAVAAYLTWTLWHLGDAEAANHYVGVALATAEAKGHPPTTAMVLSWLIFHAVCEEDLEAIERYNARLQAVCIERECRYWQPFGAACAEWAAFARDGEPHRLQRLLTFADAFEERYLRSCLLLLAARMCLALKRPSEGLDIVARAASFIAEHDERVWESEADRLRAELLMQATGDVPAAETMLQQARDVARRQGAAQLEQRAQAALDSVLAAPPSDQAARRA